MKIIHSGEEEGGWSEEERIKYRWVKLVSGAMSNQDDYFKEGDPCKCDPVPTDPAGGVLCRPGPDPGQHRRQDQGA